MQYFIIFSFILLVLLYDFLSLNFNASFLDELLVMTIALYAVWIKLKYKTKLNKFNKKIFKIFILLIITGFISNVTSKIQPLNIQFIDFIIFSKFFITYFSLSIILTKKKLIYKISLNTLYFFLLVSLFLAVLTFIDKSFNLFPIFDYKYFNMGSVELFFGHPSRFAFTIQIILILILPFIKNNKTLFTIFILILILGVFSLRTKYFVFAGITLFTIFIIKTINIKKFSFIKISIIGGLLIVSIFTFVLNDLLNHILIQDNGGQGVRGLLLFAGFDIASDYFPLGAGFATFGSYASTIQYSPLYYTYHFDVIPGCMPSKPAFLADNFYAMLLGQFGFIGLLLFFYILYLFLKLLISSYNNDSRNKYYYISALLLILMLFYESISDSIFSQNRGVFIAIYLALIINKYQLSKGCNVK